MVRRWWVSKYQLPPNHALFLDVPFAEHLEAMRRDLWERRDGIDEALDDPLLPIPARDALMGQLELVEEALGLRESGELSTTGDPLGDYWMRRQIAGTLTEADLELTIEEFMRLPLEVRSGNG